MNLNGLEKHAICPVFMEKTMVIRQVACVTRVMVEKPAVLNAQITENVSMEAAYVTRIRVTRDSYVSYQAVQDGHLTATVTEFVM